MKSDFIQKLLKIKLRKYVQEAYTATYKTSPTESIK